MSAGEVVVKEITDNKATTRQRCRVSITVAEQCALSLGQCVRICTPSKSVICRVYPTIDSGASVQYDACVTETRDSLHTVQPARQSQTLDIQCLDCHDGKEVCVKVILKDVTKHKHTPSLSGVQAELSTQCVQCLRGVCVTPGCSVDLSHSRLAKLYGITRCTVLSCSSLAGPTDSRSAVRITQQTVMTIGDVQSLECYQLVSQSQTSGERQADFVGGLREERALLADLLSLPHHLSSSQGVLLRGPPGCGKTTLVRQVADECGAALVTVNGPEVLSSNPGESESNLAAVFDKALRLSQEVPCVLFMDEVDAICPRGGNSNSSRVSTALLAQLDNITGRSGLLVVMATNRPAALDPALRRPGRLDTEILLSVPTRQQRREILDIHVRDLPLADDLDLDWLSSVTPGYVGADLELLCREAQRNSLHRHLSDGLPNKDMGEYRVTQGDMETSLLAVKPSLQRGVDSVVDTRSVPWSHIGGLDDVKLQIQQAVEWAMLYPETYAALGLPLTRGVLLYGPPGCGKTTLVQAAATACHVTFLALSCAQLYSPYVGDSEKKLSETFQKARALAPTVLFLDEIDSVVGKRSESSSGASVSERVLSTLLNEMDGIGVRLDDKTDSKTAPQREAEGDCHTSQGSSNGRVTIDNSHVLVVAATNRPDMLDAALLRPGRMDRLIFVPPPDVKGRLQAFQVHTRQMPVAGDVDLTALAQRTPGYTGADIKGICKEAGLLALKESLAAECVCKVHFDQALVDCRPSLPADIDKVKATYTTMHR